MPSAIKVSRRQKAFEKELADKGFGAVVEEGRGSGKRPWAR